MAPELGNSIQSLKLKSFVGIVAIVFVISNPLIAVNWDLSNNNEHLSDGVIEDAITRLVQEERELPDMQSLSPEFQGDDFIVFSAPPPSGNFTYPNGSTIVPMANAQTEAGLREAYKALFKRIYISDDVELVMDSFNYNSDNYPAGTLLSMNGYGGNYNYTKATEDFNISAAFALHPKRIVVFKSELQDSYGQNLTWEEGYFERIFRVYLWGDYFDTINETEIQKGGLLDYDILIMPSVMKDYEKTVVNHLGSQGAAKLRQFVRKGNTLFAQGGSGYIAEQAWLVPNGTVLLDKRIDAIDNHANITAVNTSSIMAQNWLWDKMYLVDDPVLNATNASAVVAKYTGNLINSSLLNTSAIMSFDYKNGQVILTNGHPSVNYKFYPIVFNALLSGMAEPSDIRATARQLYNEEVAPDLIPAQEPNVTVEVDLQYLNFWSIPSSKKINYTETVSSAFYVNVSSITPAPHSVTYTADNETNISWEFVDTQGIHKFVFQVITYPNTTKKGLTFISDGRIKYEPAGYRGKIYGYQDDVYIRAALAANLNGDRDIELDGCYPLPAAGFYFDIALPLENKEETTAKNITITDIVVLKSPIVDVDNQTRVPNAWNNTNNGTNESVFAINDIFFYYDSNNNPLYPLPDEMSNTTYTYQYGNNGTNITLPAKKLVWHYPNIIAYDYQEPAIRYGIFTHEEHNRNVSFLSSPMANSVILNASGGSVYTNLGIHPVPYHEYLSHGVVYIPKGNETPRVDYDDIWNRNHTMELRTVFYDIVPFPPPEEHAVVTTTYEMTYEGERLLEFPIHHEVELNFTLKTWNGYGLYNSSSYPYNMTLHKNETMIVQAIPRGVGYNIDYISSQFNENTSLIKIENTSMHTILYFQQYIEGGHKEIINVKANLSAYPEVHREGRMKINDGARFVYHQIAVGPSRYEVFDSHVQAVFAIGNDVRVDKRVAPVYIATYGDDVYHFVELEDPYEPREFLEDPYIKSYGFGGMAATTYVGGRTNDTIHQSRVEPGGRTLIRLEVDNNIGHDLHNVSITPVAPEGFKVTPDVFTTQVPPIFYDFPFINRTDIWDAWKSVYYFWVDVDPSVEGGRVYEINFTFESNCTNATFIPADFEIPQALVGVKDGNGHVSAIFGRAVNLTLTDTITSIVKPEEVRIANTAEKSAFELLIATGVSHPGDYNRSIANDSYQVLRNASFQQLGGGKLNINLPEYAQMLPWLDNGTNKKTLYVILKTNVTVNNGGTYTVNQGPKVSYKNHFNETVNVSSGGETIEAHGPAFNYNMMIMNMMSGGLPHSYLEGGESNTVDARVTIRNFGDDIAMSTTVLIRIPVEVALDSSKLPGEAYLAGSVVYWSTGDIGPGSEKAIDLVLYTTPPPQSSAANRGPPDPWVLIESAQVKFIHGFLRRPVAVPSSGPLYGQLFDSDLELTSLYFSHVIAATNHQHTIYAEVENNWPFSDEITNIKINFSIDSVFIGSRTISSLLPGENAVCNITNTFTSEGTYKIKASIIAPTMNEFYDNNNEKEVELVVVDPVTLTSQPDTGTGTDTFAASLDAALTFGDQTMLKVGRVYTGPTGSGKGFTRSMLKFDLSGIPDNALILDAELQLYMFNSVGGNLPISAYDLQSSWSEASTTWNTQPASEISPLDTTVVGSSIGYKNWDITTSVQSWVADSNTNFGLELRSDQETWYWSKQFYSSDSENGLRPKLVIHFAMLKNEPDVKTCALTVDDYKDRELRLEWNPVPYAFYYDVYRADSAAGPYTKLGTTWTFAQTGGNGSLDTFFYDDVDGGYPDAPSTIITDRANMPGTIRVQWASPDAPSPSDVYYYRIMAFGIDGFSTPLIDSPTLEGQLTPEVTKYYVYNSTSSSGPWTQVLGTTSNNYYLHSTLGQGTVMYYKLKAESSEGFQSSLSKTVWGMSNRAPSVSNPIITPAVAYTTNYLYTSYSYSDPDSDVQSGTQIRWYRDGVLISYYNDKTFVYYWSTKKDQVWHYTVKPKDGIEFGALETSGQITIQNSVPKLTNVRILPAAMYTKDTLTLSYSYADSDADSETGKQIKWFKNGVHQPSFDGLSSVPSSATVKGEVWNVSVRTSDGTDYCNWVEPAVVTIRNSLPKAAGVSVSPVTPETIDTLGALYTYSDDDSDAEKGTRIFWYKNNQYQSAYTDLKSVPASATKKGDEWYFTITPHDGEASGVKVTSPKVKIENSLPVITDLNLYPDLPKTADSLSVWYIYFDADGDMEQGTLIKWYRDNQYVSALDSSSQVDPSYTARGESWQFTLTPRDGFNYGLIFESDIIYIQNSAPEILSADIEPAKPANSETLKAEYTFADDDGDSVSEFAIRWFKDAEEIPELANLTDVLSSFTMPGETWHFELQISDTFDSSIFYTSSSVKINELPTASNLFISPVNAVSLNELTANYNWADPDEGDFESGSKITWYLNGVSIDPLDDLLTVPAKMTQKGDFWRFTIAPCDGQDYGDVLTSPPLFIINSIPVVSELIITPAVPSRSFDLSAIYNYYDADADLEQDSIINWYKNDELIEDLKGEIKVPAEMLVRNDVWYITVQPYDGDSYGVKAVSDAVVIGNAVPVIDLAMISPEAPFTSEDLEALVEVKDLDFDSGFEFEYQWYLNDEPQLGASDEMGASIPSRVTSKGDEWYFIVRVHDGNGWSVPVQSEPVIVSNSIPEAIDVTLEPEIPTHGSDLSVAYTFFDLDGDSETGTEIRWYRNGVVINEYDDKLSVPGSIIESGYDWYCTVRPSDGEEYGMIITTGQVRINFPPVITNPLLTPESPTENDNIVLSYDYFDKDSDIEGSTLIRWYSNGIHISRFDNLVLLPALATNPDERWYAVVQPHDGKELGPEVQTPEILITDSGSGISDEDQLVVVNKSKGILDRTALLAIMAVIIILAIILVVVVRRRRSVKDIEAELPVEIMSIEDAETFTMRSERLAMEAEYQSTQGLINDIESMGYSSEPPSMESYDNEYLLLDEPENQPYYLDNFLVGMNDSSCSDCDMECYGDLERCNNCDKKIA